ncbi:MAG TPA: GatB/YqeY domain-containing protein [Actinomycetota bacterium]|nr:GatB/YqeY domain-containing protein [Actinomycetota bacterium]
MDAKARLAEEMKEALRGGDKVRLGALRMLSASVKNREVELRRQVDDEEFVEVASREVKRRKEAAEAFEQAGRAELAEKERREQAVLEGYLPPRMSEPEVAALVDEAIEATGASGPADLGKVMGYVMGKAKGRVDGGRVNQLARTKLEGTGV